MGLLDRIRSFAGQGALTQTPPRPPTKAPRTTILAGSESLEVVGEASHQDILWILSGSTPNAERVRVPIVAVLAPEPDNPYDPNAIRVHIDTHPVGYLARETAAQYVPGLVALMRKTGTAIGLHGVIVGGGLRDDGVGRLGVWLDHDPADFGLQRHESPMAHPTSRTSTLRTGLSEAWATDSGDDSYDLSWLEGLPDGDFAAIATLRQLLDHEQDTIDRHFQFAELEKRLYRSRDLFTTALEEFDEVCRRHDQEMPVIVAAFLAKWAVVPRLELYHQMAIRQQKQHDWAECLKWVSRGLDMYAVKAARQDAVEDLLKRRNRAQAKIAALNAKAENPSPSKSAAGRSPEAPAVEGVPQLEALICSRCHYSFERPRTRGRKPQLCPSCRTGAAQ